jgi:hypothetical protein
MGPTRFGCVDGSASMVTEDHPAKKGEREGSWPAPTFTTVHRLVQFAGGRSNVVQVVGGRGWGRRVGRDKGGERRRSTSRRSMMEEWTRPTPQRSLGSTILFSETTGER